MKVLTHFAGAALFAAAAMVGACGSDAPASRPAAERVAAPGAPADELAALLEAKLPISFLEPADGASVKSPVKLRFAVEGVQVSPVPAGEVTTARTGMAHFHVGVDTECLAPGSIIPKAAPWVHFGNGSSEIDMQLPKGTHKLALQMGDDLHATFAGFCKTITVNVTE